LPEPIRAKLQKPIEREHLTFGFWFRNCQWHDLAGPRVRGRRNPSFTKR
jgi:hypothetical protein